MANIPAIGQAYNLAPMFSYFMKTRGADISEFEKSPQQIAYEQAVGQWQQLVMQLMKQNPEMRGDQLPPQPAPQQFGYDPQANNPTNTSAAGQEPQQSQVQQLQQQLAASGQQGGQ